MYYQKIKTHTSLGRQTTIEKHFNKLEYQVLLTYDLQLIFYFHTPPNFKIIHRREHITVAQQVSGKANMLASQGITQHSGCQIILWTQLHRQELKVSLTFGHPEYEV